MNKILRYKSEILIGLAVIFIYFLLRLPNLTAQPIFADEAIYIRWAQVMSAEPTLRFLSLQDGKTPLFMWVMIPFLGIFHDPLFAGRFLSIISGFFTFAGVYFLTRHVFSKKAAIFASILYVVIPMTVFFDRMALVDSMLSAFTIWALYFAVKLSKQINLFYSVILGSLLGGALLVKTPAMMNILSLPATILGFQFSKDTKYKLLRLLIFWGIAVILAITFYYSLRVDPNFHQLSSRNADYVFSFEELKGKPLDPFIPHIKDTIEIFSKMLTLPIIVLILIGIFSAFSEKKRLGIGILIWALIPLLLQAAFLKTFTARYILFSIPPLIVLGGFGFSRLLEVFKGLAVSKLSNVLVSLVLTFITIIQPLYFDYLLLTDYQNAPLPRNERIGYLEEWTAGYGFKEIADFAREKRKIRTVVIGTEGFFGTLPEGLRIYLDDTDIPFVTSSATVSAEIRTAAKDHFTIFVANKNRLKEMPRDSVLIKQFPKAKPQNDSPQDAIYVFEVLNVP